MREALRLGRLDRRSDGLPLLAERRAVPELGGADRLARQHLSEGVLAKQEDSGQNRRNCAGDDQGHRNRSAASLIHPITFPDLRRAR